MWRRILRVLLPTLALAGCATAGPPFSPYAGLDSGQAVVYIYRPHAFALSVLSAEIEVDGRKVAKLKNETYVAVPLTSGPHTVTQRWKAGMLGNSKLENRPISTQIVVRAGEQSFVRLGVVGSWSGSSRVVHNEWEWELRELPASDAMDELRVCHRAEMDTARQPG